MQTRNVSNARHCHCVWTEPIRERLNLAITIRHASRALGLRREVADLSIDSSPKLRQNRAQPHDLGFKGRLSLQTLHKLLVKSSKMVHLLLQVCSVGLLLFAVLANSFTVTQRTLLAVVTCGGIELVDRVLLARCEELGVSMVACVGVSVVRAWWIARVRVSASVC